MKRGILIVFTGIDGSGKTTQAKLLVEDLKSRGIDAHYIWCRWEPRLFKPIIGLWRRKTGGLQSSDGPVYKQVQKEKRQMLRNPILRFLWFSQFVIEYGLQVLWRVRMRQLMREMIISDRLFYDSFVDQAINLGYNVERLVRILDSSLLKSLFPSPDLVIYIDCPEDIAFNRKDDAPDIEYLRERRLMYKGLADRYGWVIVDGTLPVNDINKQIKEIVVSIKSI